MRACGSWPRREGVNDQVGEERQFGVLFHCLYLFGQRGRAIHELTHPCRRSPRSLARGSGGSPSRGPSRPQCRLCAPSRPARRAGWRPALRVGERRAGSSGKHQYIDVRGPRCSARTTLPHPPWYAVCGPTSVTVTLRPQSIHTWGPGMQGVARSYLSAACVARCRKLSVLPATMTPHAHLLPRLDRDGILVHGACKRQGGARAIRLCWGQASVNLRGFPSQQPIPLPWVRPNTSAQARQQTGAYQARRHAPQVTVSMGQPR